MRSLFKEFFGVSAETHTGDYTEVAEARGAVLKNAISLACNVLVEHIAAQAPSAPLQHIFRNKGPETQQAAQGSQLTAAEIPLSLVDQHTILNRTDAPNPTMLDQMAADIYSGSVDAARARVSEIHQEDLDLAV